MKVTGEATLHAPVERVYAALNDPAVLVRTIPGCERLEAAGEDAYRMTVTAGVASIKGSYAGDVRLTDQVPPERFTLRASGAGAPGTVAVLSNPLRYAFDAEAQRATQFAGAQDVDRPPVGEDDEPGLEATDYYSPLRSTFAAGMHAVVVETDPDTAEIKILRYCVVHDCGRLINPRIVEGQIHGWVAQGVGGALYERIVYDEGGQLLNASYMDFLMPYASEVPVVETDHQETPSPLNPLGIKGAGEAGVIPGAAVLASAISDAEGFPIRRMPISPSELWDLRQQWERQRREAT